MTEAMCDSVYPDAADLGLAADDGVHTQSFTRYDALHYCTVRYMMHNARFNNRRSRVEMPEKDDHRHWQRQDARDRSRMQSSVARLGESDRVVIKAVTRAVLHCW